MSYDRYKNKRTFKVGDVVELKSGDPGMLVKKLIPGSQYTCVWMTRNGELQDHVFPEACLMEHEPVSFVFDANRKETEEILGNYK